MSDRDLFDAVDGYVVDLFHHMDPALAHALETSREAGLPDIQVSAPQGAFLSILARSMGAKRILEIGTLGGFSTIWLARAVPPDGSVVTLEVDPRHARVARENVAFAGLSHIVDVVAADAHEALASLIAQGTPPFDFVFIDAEKSGYPAYLDAVLDLVRPGSLIVADNVVRHGNVTDATSDDPDVAGVRTFNEALAREPTLRSTVIQTVGGKGHDGFALALVEASR